RSTASASRTCEGAWRPAARSVSRRNADGRTARAARSGAHRNQIPARFTMRGIEAKTRTARSNTIAFWYRSPRIRSPRDISSGRLERTYSVAIRSPTLSPTPPPGLRLYTAIAIESRGGLHRARRPARHGPGPGAPGDLAARPHGLLAHPGPNPRVLRRGHGHSYLQ